MPDFHFHCPIEIRYADLDPQGHVNNAVFLSYFEQGRIKYLVHLGLIGRDEASFDVGIILADARVTYLVPVVCGMDLRVGVRIARVGNKSMMMEYQITDPLFEQALATGSTVLVAFDYDGQKSVPIPDVWREKISKFENL